MVGHVGYSQRLNQFVCEKADFVISPQVTEFHWADFGAGEACRARGYSETQARLQKLQGSLRWRANPRYHMKMKVKHLLRMHLD